MANSLVNCTPVTLDYFTGIREEAHERQVYVAIAYGVICAVGLIANVMLMTSLLGGGSRGVTYRTPSTILIMNLAIADMLLLLTLPFAIVHRLQDKWIFGNAACKIEEGVKFLNYYGSIFFITAMAVDRYVSLCRSPNHDRALVRKRLWLASACVWVLALVFVIPLMVYADVDNYGFCTIIFPGSQNQLPDVLDDAADNNSSTMCLESFYYYPEYSYYDVPGVPEDGKPAAISSSVEMEVSCRHPPVTSLHVWLVCNFLIGFVIPFTIVSVSYARIIHLKSSIFGRNDGGLSPTWSARGDNREQFVPVSPGGDEQGKKFAKRNHRAKMIMGILVPCLILAFAICWLPYHTWHLAQISGVLPGVDSNVCNIIREVTFCLAFFNSALNPILNSFFLFNFKERLQRSSTWLKKFSTRRITRLPGRTPQAKSLSKDRSHESVTLHDVTLMTTGLSMNDVSKSVNT